MYYESRLKANVKKSLKGFWWVWQSIRINVHTHIGIYGCILFLHLCEPKVIPVATAHIFGFKESFLEQVLDQSIQAPFLKTVQLILEKEKGSKITDGSKKKLFWLGVSLLFQ